MPRSRTGSGSTTTNYGFTGTGASFAMNSSDTITEDYPTLPGGLTLTLRPGQTGAASQTASLSNLHGNVIATLDGTNTLNGTFTYDPFGNLISTGGQPTNTTNSAAFGWAGASGKFTETALALNPIQMGARVYLPSIGRFASVEPESVGLPNLSGNTALTADGNNSSTTTEQRITLASLHCVSAFASLGLRSPRCTGIAAGVGAPPDTVEGCRRGRGAGGLADGGATTG